ncbi:PucR family transcriptional regulator [Spirillospora sp. NPDC050679]
MVVGLAVGLRALLAVPELRLRLLAGEAGLDRPVRRVFITDLPDPGRYLAGGELVLTGLMWRRGGADSEAFVAAVAGRGAVAVAAGAAAHGGVPGDLVAACRRRGLPLLEVPVEVSFADVARWASVERRGALLTAAAHGLEPAFRLLAADLGVPCWIVTPTGRVVAGSEPLEPGTAVKLSREYLRGAAAARLHGADYAIRELGRGGRVGHWFLAARGALPWEREETVADLEALTVLTAARARERERTGEGEALVRALLEGSQSAEALRARLAGLGLPPDVPAHALALDGPAEAVRTLLDDVLRVHAAPVLAAECGGETLVVHGPAGPVAERLRAALEVLRPGLGGARVTAGTSSGVVARLGARDALLEARRAHRLARLRGPGGAAGAVVAGEEAGVGDLLVAALPAEVRDRFRRGLLGALEDYDARHNSELVPTLAVFLARSGSWRRCADELHLHVNTVRYRIRRVEELTGRDLSDLSECVDFHLALRIAEWDGAARVP